MSTWKLSIKPDAAQGYDAFALCQRQSIVGVGWSYVFEGRNIRSKEEAYQALIELEKEHRVPRPVEMLLEEVRTGDFIWLHQSGGYFLCKIKDDLPVIGTQITSDFSKYDLAHARNAEWVQVPQLLVPGRVQRSTIAQRMIQRIKCSDKQEDYFRHLHAQLSRDPDWFPDISEESVAEALERTSLSELADLLTPDDYEDMVAAFLQSKGWMLVKSTCFRSKPQFEFLLVQPGPLYGHVQVKSGAVQLCPADYRERVSSRESVFLFSTHPEPYPGPSVDKVITLDPQEIMLWTASNTWTLSLGLKLQLQLSQSLNKSCRKG